MADGHPVPIDPADIAAIRAVTDNMSVLTETNGILATDGTEQNTYIENAPAGMFRPICVKIDFTNHGAGETCVVRTYYRIETGGALIKEVETTYAGVQDPLLIPVSLDPNRFGVAVTVERTAGVTRNYRWEACYET